MEESNKRIIEINGVKMEVDLRHAKTIDTYKVGDNVKVLIKEYNDTYKSNIGVIIALDEYEKMPTIVVAYLEISYSSADLKTVYINSASKDIEITKLNDWDIPYTKSEILLRMDRDIQRKEIELKELETQKKIFLDLFSTHFNLKE